VESGKPEKDEAGHSGPGDPGGAGPAAIVMCRALLGVSVPFLAVFLSATARLQKEITNQSKRQQQPRKLLTQDERRR